MIDVVEPDVIGDFDDASNGDVVGVFWQPNEYAINSNMQFGMKRYFDEETNEWVDKYIEVLLMKSQQKKLLIMCFLAFTFSISYYGVLLGINKITEQTFYYGFFMNFIGEVISLLSSGIISDCLVSYSHVQP